jgi:hypothetical protein
VTADGLTVDSGTVDTVATFQSSGDANAYVVVKDSGSSGGAFIGAVGTHTILGTGGSTERMRIDSSGNVGIGRTPRVMLDVAGEVAIAYDATYGLRFYNQDQNNWSSIGNNIATGSSAANLVFKDSTGEVMRLSSGNVGIGTSSPQAAKFSGSAVGILELANTKPVINIHETDVTDAEFFMGMSGGSAVIGTSGNGLMIFQTGTSSTSERMRIDSSGNVLVGTTSDNVANQSGTTQGVRIAGAQNIQVASTGIAAYFNRLSTDGDIVEFRRAGTAVGSIGTTSGNLYIQGNPATGKSGLTFYGSYIEPRDNGAAADAAIDLGISSGRFKDIYRSGSTISTSDRNMKQDIRDLTDAERNVAVAAKGLLKAFRFIDTVAAEGDSANIHFGIIAQDLAAAFEAEGLDANDYQVYRADTFTDDDGNEQTRLGICYENLLAFIIAAI